MKSKILSLFLLTAILSIVMVSAADLTFTQTIDSQTFTSTIAGPVSVQTNIATTYSDGTTVIPTTVDQTNTPIFTVNTTADYDELDVGSKTGTLILTNGTDTEPITVEFIKTFCEAGEQ